MNSIINDIFKKAYEQNLIMDVIIRDNFKTLAYGKFSEETILNILHHYKIECFTMEEAIVGYKLFIDINSGVLI